jgi:hypothetical protein
MDSYASIHFVYLYVRNIVIAIIYMLEVTWYCSDNVFHHFFLKTRSMRSTTPFILAVYVSYVHTTTESHEHKHVCKAELNYCDNRLLLYKANHNIIQNKLN